MSGHLPPIATAINLDYATGDVRERISYCSLREPYGGACSVNFHDYPKEPLNMGLSMSGPIDTMIGKPIHRLEETMTLLAPDHSREQREDFVWCIPIDRAKWNKWYGLAEKFKTITPEGVRYMNRMEGKKVRTILVMPNAEQSDDDAINACAWLRMAKGLTCRFYVLRCTDQPLQGAALVHAVMGTDPSHMEEVPDDEET